MKHLRNAEDVMPHAVISVHRRTAFEDVVEALRTWNVSALPVLAQDGQVVGVVSRGDLLKVFLRPDEAIGAEMRPGTPRRR
ncbi:CBS domain-containing protein [Streptomyces sp. NBC_01343]|uniref:CBS domain-containing protein n=1 Tax=Streptomyces sp. NBC_01343 TaxID=2903832 RepID=UPI002E158BA4|nr:CBS domain-containing protein [Streptomyces sp. NBC_01343]